MESGATVQAQTVLLASTLCLFKMNSTRRTKLTVKERIAVVRAAGKHLNLKGFSEEEVEAVVSMYVYGLHLA